MDRSRRHSLHGDSSNMVISALRDKIKSIEDERGRKLDLIDPMRYGAVIHQEQILVNKRSKTVRRAYMVDHRYKIGWVVDWDHNNCMVCNAPFGWFLGRPKHHCRACGALVCHACSPYVTTVPGLNEFGGSRVCIDCFGLKPGMFGSPQLGPAAAAMSNPSATTRASEVYARGSPMPSPGNSFSSRYSESVITSGGVMPEDAGSVRRPRSSRPRASTSAAAANASGMSEEEINRQLEQFEREQRPLYEQDYLKMREFVPLDIHKSSVPKMVAEGLTPEVAQRVWNVKALSLICTHPDDIRKIHLADFRGQYNPEGLDVVEMRAIWYNLPVWDDSGANPLEVGKAEWRAGFKSRMDNLVYKLHAGTLAEHLKRNPVYEECSLKHVYDPTIPLRTRYDRSAAHDRYAIESPMIDGDGPRAQQKPKPIPQGHVRQTKQAYLSNFEDSPGQVSERWDGEDGDSQFQDYLYEYEEGDSKLDEGIAAFRNGGQRSNRAGGSARRHSDRPFAGLGQDINAEVVSDLDEEDGDTDSYSFRQQQGEVDDTVLQNYVPYQGRSPMGAGASGRQSHGQSSSSVRSDRSAGGSSQQRGGGGDNSSQSSFHFRAPGAHNAAHHTPASVESAPRISQHGKDSHSPTRAGIQKQHSGPVAMTPSSTVRTPPPSQTLARQGSSPIPGLTHSPSPISASLPAQSFFTAGRNSYSGPSPTPSTRSSTSPVPAGGAARPPALAAVPAYAYNQPNSFVPKRDEARSPMYASGRPDSFRADASPVPYGSGGAQPATYSARRLEREQARRMRTAAARAETEGYDQEGLVPDSEDPGYDPRYDAQQYGVHSPTSSLSSHNDSTSQSMSRAGNSAGPVVQSAGQNLESFAPGRYVHSNGITSSEASVGKDVPAVALQTPPPVQSRGGEKLQTNQMQNETHQQQQASSAAAALEEEFEEGDSDGSGSYMTDDDDLSFNTAEEIKTPMLHNGHRANKDGTVRTGRRGGRTPKTAFQQGQSEGGELDVAQARDSLFKYLMIGDANSVTEVLKTVYNAVPVIPLTALIEPAQSSELMMQCFKDHLSLIHADQTLKVLLDTLQADVNYVESDTGKCLLHYMVEQDEKKLGRILINKGADIMREDHAGTSPLALSLSRKIDWVLGEFQSSGRQAQLLQSGQTELKLKYATYLIFAGHSKLAAEVIRVGGLQISAEDASHLLASCQGNFENMKEPVETFELLESLGASC